MSDRTALARAIAARSKTRFIEIKRQKKRLMPFTHVELLAIKQGRWAEKERERLTRSCGRD